MPMKPLEITNQRFGYLVAIKRLSKRHDSLQWLCQCDCGNSHIAEAKRLRGRGVRSCGCKKGNHRHGYAKAGKQHPIYNTWIHMRDRCTNPNADEYKNYGARGIIVCERWNSFANFLADILASIGERPHGLTLDRINNNGNYEPSNVRWATRKEQNNNKRKMQMIDQFTTAELEAELLRRRQQHRQKQ